MARLPVQSPLASQVVAFVVVQASVALPPCTTFVGVAVRSSVGAGVGGVTVTVVVALAVPPGPLQLSTNTELCVRALVTWLPEVALLPDQAPDATHDVALLLDQASVELPPDATIAGLADSVTVGAGGSALTATFAVLEIEPLGPEQVSVYA